MSGAALAFTVVIMGGLFQILFGILRIGKSMMSFSAARGMVRHHAAMQDYDIMLLDLM